jgi:pyruvate/2-oxoglutarate dehydrogenase complex dihydrolipoamide acyltransferase (E2) component
MSPARKATGWRKIAAASWRSPSDPQIYGDLEVDATRLLEYADAARRASGVRVTVTHLVGKAVARALGEHPELNAMLARGRFVPRDSVSIFFVASLDGGGGLSGVKVRDADRKAAVDIAEELAQRVERIRGGDDAELGSTKRVLELTPTPLLRLAIAGATRLTADFGVDLRRFGVPRDPFGSAIVTSVGMFGVQHAYGPLSPYYRVPLLALVGEVAKKPVVVDDEVVARPVLSIATTMDHRYLDGFHAARLASSAREYLSDPAAHEPARP